MMRLVGLTDALTLFILNFSGDEKLKDAMARFNNISMLNYSMDSKQEFFEIYSNLPIEERKKVVVVIDEEPISWNLACKEIKNNTKRGGLILNTLKELEIL